ncbi:hypothetical protein [Flavobacterium sharifuzzamanii]|uniref:hypothetical protein n=1 Tax=Flavobacterium sharifuzzamanii TaxID=2211133 RepID=UPI000DAD4867|nr:hypothetical protein [Flavobacterium sharifuzzamanii]KAF2081791.1 hypothetical protein DMA14_08310 [Flavobacterium sharifuzzamanii]
MKKFLLLLILIILFVSCDKKHETIRSFCYWKTDLNFDKKDDSIIKRLKVKHLYIRFFDVDWSSQDNEPVPVADIRNVKLNKSQLEITPSVFITNEVFLKTNKGQLDTLALRIMKRINQIAIREKILPKNDFQEILIDCDWSPKSRENYFYLLKQIKKSFTKTKLSATIRLWQYKYTTKAGTPPIDRGLLMCYNITKPNDLNTENSIGTSRELSQYITHNKYKLKLDIALPLYSWAVVFRGNQYKGIISDYEQLINGQTKMKEIAPNKYLLKEDILIGKTYLRNGDLIRIEKISDEELEKMISIVKNKIEIDNKTKISFFSFDEKYINNYKIQNISKYYAHF